MQVKRLIFIGIVAVVPLLILSCGNDHHGDMGDGMMEDGHMGSGGMMGDRQGMMGDTMGSGQGGMMGGGQMQSDGQRKQQALTMEQARQRAEEYLQNTGNTSLKIGAGTDRANEYEFPVIRTSDGSRVASLLVNKTTGKIRSQR